MPTVFDENKLRKELLDNQNKLTTPDVFSNSKLVATISKRNKIICEQLDKLNSIHSQISELTNFITLSESEEDISVKNLIDSELTALEKLVNQVYLQTLLNGQYDNTDCFVKIHSGAGGTEACDWVEMLFRMYKMFCDKMHFGVTITSSVDGDDAGYKSIEFSVTGDFAYGYLKSEIGVHRLVRISPFDSSKRRHTSFASVEVMPKMENDEEIVINSDDLRIDTYRSGGKGGQHVNTTDSAVRITHIPTGIVVECQNERSQMQNKALAMEMLKSKLLNLKIEQQKSLSKELKGDNKSIEWGSQIRSYVFCPYTMVKDHRTDYEVSDVDSVMNGNIIDFMFAYLKGL